MGARNGVSDVLGIQDYQGSVRIDVAPQILDFPCFGNELMAIMLTVIVIIIIVIMIIIIVKIVKKHLIKNLIKIRY